MDKIVQSYTVADFSNFLVILDILPGIIKIKYTPMYLCVPICMYILT